MTYLLVLKNLFKEKKYLKLFIVYNIIFIILSFVYQNINSAVQIFYINFFSFSEKLISFIKDIFDISFIKDFYTLILFLVFILSISLFFVLLKALYDKTGQVSRGKSFWGSVWIFLSILGLSCVSCGIGLLASLLSFLGISSIVLYLPFHGLEFAFLGVFSLNISNYFLLKRLKNPFICD